MSNYKMVLVVRTDLGMGKGKIAAQVGHAVAQIMWNSLAGPVSTTNLPEQIKVTSWMMMDTPAQTKIVLKVNSEKELLDLAAACDKAGMMRALIADAGKTQVDPGTFTVLGIGPDLCEKIDAVTGGLSLL